MSPIYSLNYTYTVLAGVTKTLILMWRLQRTVKFSITQLHTRFI